MASRRAQSAARARGQRDGGSQGRRAMARGRGREEGFGKAATSEGMGQHRVDQGTTVRKQERDKGVVAASTAAARDCATAWVSAAAYAGLGQGEAMSSAVGAAVARGHAVAAMAAVGLLPRSSLSSHLRGSSLLSFFK